jgi:hypothetical protein
LQHKGAQASDNMRPDHSRFLIFESLKSDDGGLEERRSRTHTFVKSTDFEILSEQAMDNALSTFTHNIENGIEQHRNAWLARLFPIMS